MLQRFISRKLLEKVSPSIHKSAVMSSLNPEDSWLADDPPDPKVIQLCGLDNKAINTARRLLEQGEVIAVPTDTVFGLACDSSNTAAINKLYEIKGRDKSKPLAICVCAVSEVKKYSKTTYLPKGLLKSLLPGPVTVILERKPRLNPDLNPGITNVGIRVPGTIWHPFIDFVTSALGQPLALTSANLSNEPNCIHVEEFKSLWPKLGGVFDTSINMVDHGWNTAREGSTIVDLTEPGRYRIVRKGLGYDRAITKLKKFFLEEVE
ncbi:threonylcarbamoyl-AMP synthase [Macrosteles quadrilineatus]|uniref:threonylcarbamoyl-AMP synthase n=1 Tax=Macrosteles quadrilineatus TaxID=74068 RepID=UPI0023E1CD33|nr:threonylcarbamoyl-AMP synthase [Macrosteles quadrilineatus]